MPESFPIDLDSEKVLFDGAWYRKDELAQKIKAMVDGGDYKVTRPSAALEALEASIGALRTVSVRLPTDVAEGLAAAAARVGKSLEGFVREALARSVGAALPQAHTAPPQLSPVVPQAAAPIALGKTASFAAAPAPAPIALGSPVAPPEAASHEESPIALTSKKVSAQGPGPGDAEKGWFDRR
ncbi:MAG: hypothetical protein ACYCWW_01280 [Deltaproteobacteria bacterium]